MSTLTGKYTAMVGPNKKLPKELDHFVGKQCRVTGDMDGLLLRVRMIESEGGETWSI